jgi:hypothetical protein
LGDDSARILIEDTSNWLNEVQKNGFIPSPYNFTTKRWESTEFAAFALIFCRDAYHFINVFKKQNKKILKSVINVCNEALEFLKNCCYEDRGKISWSVTSVFKTDGETHTNAFSTSNVLVALQRLSSYEDLFEPLEVENRRFCNEAIRGASLWLLDCYKEGRFEEHHRGGRRDLGFSFAAIGALSPLVLLDILAPPQKEVLQESYKKLIEHARTDVSSTIGSFNLEGRLNNDVFLYETGWSSKNAVISIASASSLAIVVPEVFKEHFDLLSQLQTKYWAERDEEMNLWDINRYKIRETHYGVVATLSYVIEGQPRRFTISEGQLREVIRQAATSEEFFRTFLRAFERIQRVANRYPFDQDKGK